MWLSRQQLVSDLLHDIAHFVYEADLYLRESDLYQSSVKSLPAPKDGIQPHEASKIDNRMRKMRERFDKPQRDILRAKRERDQRSRYQSHKLTQGVPRKILGMRFRKR